MASDEEASEDDLMKPQRRGHTRAREKWGYEIVRSGYTLVPNHLIDINLYLRESDRIDATEFFVLMIVISKWWEADQPPAASKQYIAERCCLSTRQVQRVIQQLCEKRVIRRAFTNRNTGGATQYDLKRLLRLLQRIALAYDPKEKRVPKQLNLAFDDEAAIVDAPDDPPF